MSEYSLSEFNMLRSLDDEILKSMNIDLDEYKKSLSKQLIEKGKRNGLVPVEKQVTRGGKTFSQVVWVKPSQAKEKQNINHVVHPSKEKSKGIDKELRAKAKAKVDALKKEQGSDTLYENLKNDKRFNWKSNDKVAVDKMRAFMSLREYFEEQIQKKEAKQKKFDEKQKEFDEKQKKFDEKQKEPTDNENGSFQENADKLSELFSKNDISFEAFSSSDEHSFIVNFEDGNGKKGTINVEVTEDGYIMSTSKAKDNHEDKNHRSVKTPKAVLTYVNKHSK